MFRYKASPLPLRRPECNWGNRDLHVVTQGLLCPQMSRLPSTSVPLTTTTLYTLHHHCRQLPLQLSSESNTTKLMMFLVKARGWSYLLPSPVFPRPLSPPPSSSSHLVSVDECDQVWCRQGCFQGVCRVQRLGLKVRRYLSAFISAPVPLDVLGNHSDGVLWKIQTCRLVFPLHRDALQAWRRI